MDLLTNAIESIQSGVEDYQAATRPRLLSAVRNIHAGILLLYKEALLRRSPQGSNEVLIRARIKPVTVANGAITFVGDGRKTVDTIQIQERFQSLGISTDWSRFNAVAMVRNDIEHYYPTVTQDSLRGLISSSFLLVRTFLAKELKEDPRAILGSAWQAMVDVAEVYEAERKECDAALATVDWGSETLAQGVRELHCSKCASDLLRPSHHGAYDESYNLSCRTCGQVIDAYSFVPQAIAAALEGEAYDAAREGGYEPYAECPECDTESYVVAESRCAYCGATPERECDRCGNAISPSELHFSPLCSYCDHLMAKDD